VPDAKDMYIPGKVVKTFKTGEEGTFKSEEGKVRLRVSSSSGGGGPLGSTCLVS